jgi:hypothetical protein
MGAPRVRVSECWSTLRAEDLYSDLLSGLANGVRPGASGAVTYVVGGAGASRCLGGAPERRLEARAGVSGVLAMRVSVCAARRQLKLPPVLPRLGMLPSKQD